MMRIPIRFLAIFIGLVLTFSANASEIVVIADANPVDIHPIHLTVSQDGFWEPLADGEWMLVNDEEKIPLQVIKRSVIARTGHTARSYKHVWDLFFVVKGLTPYEKRTYQIMEADESNIHISVAEQDGKILVQSDGNPYTEYRYDVTDEQPRPILYPVHGPKGVEMTRGYPMEPAKNTEKKDHPHHQSLWVSHGDVNKVNFWHLGEKQGYQRHVSFSTLAEGPVVGRIEANISWEDEEGNHVLDERRVMTFWALDDDMRMIDVDSTFIASTGDVIFGDTKEGGLLSLRVAGTLREENENGGTITNTLGAVGASETWGKPAPWCDYSGPVGDIMAGLTIMDHPENPFYPTRYHVRNYGLFTANPFGLSHFIGKDHDGTQTLKHGNTWRCRYRVYIHPGDAESGNVAGQYNAFADPPRVTLW